ncbi:hypothetical protein [Methanosarcina barkeri]|uniref:Uncharacterized protein n=1 Tax=Methanosarcina barkeri CM1 TaxID=796385 RepID=A0A0G3CGJ3_METBA|nr:hypothetical protein [Methanosarcina barkeri]AKJ39053.1 hypothetical protein MCM1_2032 [Methanosarcina barkeri CM1]
MAVNEKEMRIKIIKDGPYRIFEAVSPLNLQMAACTNPGTE